jgi:ATP-dependent DNA helicase PIF1
MLLLMPLPLQSWFPMQLGYALTAHKAQGATIRGDVVLFVRDAFACGIMYVLLSRVLKRDQLHIVTPILPEHFKPVPDQYLGLDD